MQSQITLTVKITTATAPDPLYVFKQVVLGVVLSTIGQVQYKWVKKFTVNKTKLVIIITHKKNIDIVLDII